MEKNMQKNLYRYTHIYVKLSFARHQKLIQHCESTFTSFFKRRKKKNRSVLSCVCARSLETFLTLCDPMDHSLPSSSVHGILQARILEWVTLPSSRRHSQPRDQTHVSYISCIGRHWTTWETELLPCYCCSVAKLSPFLLVCKSF